MAANVVPRIAIQMPDEYRAHFQEMADEADMSLTGLMAALLLDLADDDRRAHGKASFNRKGATFRAGRSAA